MADDFIPPKDDEFHKFQDQLITAVTPNPAKYGLLPQDLAALQAAQVTWIKAYAGHTKAQQDALTATETKDTVRGDFETALRATAKKIHATAGTDNSLRVSAGLPPRDTARSSIGAPTTRPLGRLEAMGHLMLIIHFVDETTPTRLAKPQGAQGCQIWKYVGTAPPADASGYAFLALDTRTPYTDEHDAADAGKNAYYLLRWQNAKGEPGPWSDVVTAKIPL